MEAYWNYYIWIDSWRRFV